jgi:hypothetical protein
MLLVRELEGDSDQLGGKGVLYAPGASPDRAYRIVDGTNRVQQMRRSNRLVALSEFVS